MLDGVTRREILVIASSPQELTVPPAQLRTFLQQAAGRRRVIGCVIALQPTRTNRRLLGVLREAQRNRFSLYIFILDPGYNAGRGSAPVFGPVVVAVRGARITATLTRLDGRRFAHLNAVRIRQRAGIP